MPDVLPAFADVEAAAARTAPYVRETPLLEAPSLNERVGARVLFKAEGLQLTGSFKVRGAFNRLLRMSPEALAAGVVAFSSGNHGQALAAAARRLGAPALIFMPADAPPIKIEKTRGFGAEVRLYDRTRDDREALTRAAARERGAVLVPPFEDPDIIAGQGAGALEAFRQAAPTLPDAVLVPCSGGGLAAGWALVTRALAPRAAFYLVEPEGFTDAARSLQAGRVERNPPGAGSICDSLLASAIGEINLHVLLQANAQALAVSDAATRRAMFAAFADLKLVLEPGGAVALAATLEHARRFAGGVVLVLGSGAHVDPALFSEMLNDPACALTEPEPA